MKQFIAVALLVASGWAQGTIDLSNPATPPAAGYAPGAPVPLNVTKTDNPTTTGLQFTLSLPSGVANMSVALGPAVSPSSKSLTCGILMNPVSCIIVGFNADTIPDGVVAVATVTLANTITSSPVTETLANPIESDSGGHSLPVTSQNPTVSLSIKNGCDVNGDGAVSSADLAAVVSQAVSNATTPTSDLNKDGVTNVLDAQMVATAGTPPAFTCNAK